MSRLDAPGRWGSRWAPRWRRSPGRSHRPAPSARWRTTARWVERLVKETAGRRFRWCRPSVSRWTPKPTPSTSTGCCGCPIPARTCTRCTSRMTLGERPFSIVEKPAGGARSHGVEAGPPPSPAPGGGHAGGGPAAGEMSDEIGEHLMLNRPRPATTSGGSSGTVRVEDYRSCCTATMRLVSTETVAGRTPAAEGGRGDGLLPAGILTGRTGKCGRWNSSGRGR